LKDTLVGFVLYKEVDESMNTNSKYGKNLGLHKNNTKSIERNYHPENLSIGVTDN